MAIALEFIDFIVPIKLIEEKYPGGWEACLRDHASYIGSTIWYDKHLFRDGAMAPDGIKMLLDRWTTKGFIPYTFVEGEEIWKDVCVVQMGSPTLPCDWIDINPQDDTAWLAGTEPGEVIWGGNVKPSNTQDEG